MVTDSSAQLILATGSRAGLVAPIHTGYYMIGRDRECQIRPKSRSVSRRHCLLHWEIPDGSPPRFRIFDLDSTSGTRVDGTRIPKRTWVELVDGAELRCGKIAFELTIQDGTRIDAGSIRTDAQKPSSATVSSADTVISDPESQTLPGIESSLSRGIAESTNAKIDAKPARKQRSETPAFSLIQGEAWQEVDIASFLQAEDDVAREARYDNIRAKTAAQDAAASESGIFDADEDFFDDDVADNETNAPSSQRDADRGSTSNSAPSRAAKRASSGGPSVFQRIDWDKVKLLAACVMTVGVIVFGAYQAVQFWSGPEVRIVDGID
nr:FHA domain-containing protein [Rhodopirellula sp. JC740]